MKTVLITGSNGLLGQALIKLYQEKKDVRFVATSRGDNRCRPSLSYQYMSMDITNQEEVKEVFENFEPDVVINTAAMTNVDACESDREGCRALNVTGVQHLIDGCREHNAHLIQVSTDFVFDGEDGPYREDDEPNPLSYYAESKREAEILVEESGLDHWSIARTIIVYGTGTSLSKSNIVLWAIETLQKGEAMTIVDDQFRSPTWAPDLAMGCALIAEKQAKGIYHISGPEMYSMHEMVTRIAAHMELDTSLVKAIKTEELGRPAPRPPKTGFIIDKARQDLGYDPHQLEETLTDIIAELEKNYC